MQLQKSVLTILSSRQQFHCFLFHRIVEYIVIPVIVTNSENLNYFTFLKNYYLSLEDEKVYLK